ncbi:MAG TPA: serpin family protein [Kofleriaceae bacterium]|jgi:serpin B
MLRPTLACSLLALAAPACTSSGDPPEVKSDLARNMTPSNADVPQLVHDNTAFAADLYGQVAAAAPKDNLFLSAHSISTALAMTYAGAETTTASQMAATMHFTLPPAQLHAAFDALDLALASRATSADSTTIPFQLHNASSLWGQTGMDFQQPFLDTLAVNYGAGLRVQDFVKDPEGSRGTINDWVSKETNDKIPDLLGPGTITTETRFVIANAIYFTAAWQDPFKEGDTTNDAFTNVSGESVTVPTLHGGGEWEYASAAGYEAVEIPYDGGQLGMIVVVPDDLATFEASLDGETIEGIESALHGAAITLSMPKFEFSSPFSLKDALQALGMTSAFGEDADFSGIDGARDIFIAAVLHKGFLHIDEKGTEAAAATAVIGAGDAEEEQHTVVVNKPFLIFIHDRPTNAILFQGRMADPSQAQGE